MCSFAAVVRPHR